MSVGVTLRAQGSGGQLFVTVNEARGGSWATFDLSASEFFVAVLSGVVRGTSAHDRPVSLTVNPISRTHAETDVMQQLANLGGAGGRRATLYVDHPGGWCGARGRSGAVKSMAKQVGIEELTVVWPGGRTVIVP